MKTIEFKRMVLWQDDQRDDEVYIDSSVSDDDVRKTFPDCRINLTSLVIFDDIEEVLRYQLAELRRSAWTKLTDAERVALGMEEPK